MPELIATSELQGYGRYEELKNRLDGASWERTHTLVFITISASLFVWGVVLAVGPLVITWPVVTPSSVLYILVAAPSGLLTGNLCMGMLADRLGRKKSFMITLLLSIAGLAGILLSSTVSLLIASLFLTEFGFGGEETVSLALMSELFPIRYRGMALVGSTNFANVGAMLVALAFIVSPFSIIDEKIMIAGVAAAGLAASRRSCPKRCGGRSPAARRRSSATRIGSAISTRSQPRRPAFNAIGTSGRGRSWGSWPSSTRCGRFRPR